MGKMILSACSGCGKKRLVRVRKGIVTNLRCRKCAKKLNDKNRKWYNLVYSLGYPVKTGSELGYKVGGFYVLHPCNVCGKQRWVRFVRGIITSFLCPACNSRIHSMSGSPVWSGGRRRLHGYIEVLLPFNSPYLAMAGPRRNILEHRLVMAQSLGRLLEGWEIVHHKNHIKDDNRLENLELMSSQNHPQITLLEIENKKLKARIKVLENLVKLEGS